MIVLIDSTVIFHLYYRKDQMAKCFNHLGITETITTDINYLEILSGASEHRKVDTRKFLRQFALLELNNKSIVVANKLAMKYRVSKPNQRDFLIACIAIANRLPLLTENTKDFN